MARRRYQQPTVQRSTTARPYWFIRFRDYTAGGRDVQRVIGWCDEMGKRAAEKVRDEVMVPINNTPVSIPSQTPLSEFVRTYREVHLATVRPQSKVTAESELTKHILPQFGGKRLCDVQREHVQRWVNGLKFSRGYRGNLVRRLHHIYEEADRLGYFVGRNPATKINLTGETPERELIQAVQYRELCARLQEPYRLAVRLAVQTGLRIGEIRGLQRGDLDFDAGEISVRRQILPSGLVGPPKTKSSVRVVAMDDLAGQLRELAQWPQEFLFPQVCYWTWKERLRDAAEAAGITARRFGWHTLRALFATTAHAEGVGDLAIRDALGHGSIKTTGRYAQVSRKRVAGVTRIVREALAK